MNSFRAEKWASFNHIFLIIVLFVLFFSFPTNALAQTNPTCPSVYGAACPSGHIFIDKKVQNPKSGEFVDALSSLDVTFAPEQEVNFRIEVKNTGSSDLNNVFVQDRLPGNTNFISGPGSYDKNTNIFSWIIDKLAPNESKFFQVKLKVKSQAELQFDIACMTNFVQAQKDKEVAQDTSVFCIQPQPLKSPPPVTEMPKTGLPIAVWALSGLLLPTGLRLRKFASNNTNVKDDASFIWQVREFSKREGGE